MLLVTAATKSPLENAFQGYLQSRKPKGGLLTDGQLKYYSSRKACTPERTIWDPNPLCRLSLQKPYAPDVM